MGDTTNGKGSVGEQPLTYAGISRGRLLLKDTSLKTHLYINGDLTYEEVDDYSKVPNKQGYLHPLQLKELNKELYLKTGEIELGTLGHRVHLALRDGKWVELNNIRCSG
jgi:hypothetical protein